MARFRFISIPQVDSKLGISLGMEIGEVAKAIKANPDATAVLVNNPTYYGICSDLRSIVKLAHEHNMLCLVDEAHGTHFLFRKKICLLMRWRPVLTWHLFLCINQVAV